MCAEDPRYLGKEHTGYHTQFLEHYDCRLSLTDPEPAVVINDPVYILEDAPAPVISVQTKKPVQEWMLLPDAEKRPNGGMLYDFGTEIAAHICLSLVGNEGDQVVLAYVAAVAYVELEDILAAAEAKGEEPFIILLDGITDPHNLGAIVRSAECAGAHGVVIPERRAAGLTPAAAKAAAGALNYMPIARVKNLNRAIETLQEKNIWVIGTAMDGENAFTADFSGPVALVIGSEGEGISRLTLEKCDRTVALPMKGRIESLNASVAAGILMYEIARARAR